MCARPNNSRQWCQVSRRSNWSYPRIQTSGTCAPTSARSACSVSIVYVGPGRSISRASICRARLASQRQAQHGAAMPGRRDSALLPGLPGRHEAHALQSERSLGVARQLAMAGVDRIETAAQQADRTAHGGGAPPAAPDFMRPASPAAAGSRFAAAPLPCPLAARLRSASAPSAAGTSGSIRCVRPTAARRGFRGRTRG